MPRGKHVVSLEARAKLSSIARERLEDKTCHPRYGVTLSQDTKDKISRALKGKPATLSEVGRKAISEASKKRRGKHYQTEESKKKIRIANTRFALAKEELEKLYVTEGMESNEIATKFAVSKSTVINKLNQYGIPIRSFKEQLLLHPERKVAWAGKISEHHKGKMLAPDPSGVFKRLNRDPVFIAKRVKALNASPNHCELILIKLFEDNSLPYRYTGNGEFIIGTYCPDFVNTNGKKVAIEFNGCYFHSCPICGHVNPNRSQEEERRKLEKYEAFGWKLLVIWEHELSDLQRVLDKVKKIEMLISGTEVPTEVR